MYKTTNARTSTQNLTYRKISGFNPIIESNGKKESDFFFNHKLANLNSESYLRKNSWFNLILESNRKTKSDFFFNQKLHQIKNTLPEAKPLVKKMPYQSKIVWYCTWIQIYRQSSRQDAVDFSHWDNDDNSINYFIPKIKDENDLNIFLVAPYPPPLIGRYD